MTEHPGSSELNFYEDKHSLLRVATGYNMRSDKVKRLREAAEMLNQIKGRNFFIVETIPSDENTALLQPGFEQARIVGEWLNEDYPDLSELRVAERAIAAALITE